MGVPARPPASLQPGIVYAFRNGPCGQSSSSISVIGFEISAARPSPASSKIANRITMSHEFMISPDPRPETEHNGQPEAHSKVQHGFPLCAPVAQKKDCFSQLSH